MLQNYEIKKKLGEGGFGQVYLAEEKISKRSVAIKSLNEKDPYKQTDIVDEIRTLSSMNHPNIIGYYHTEIVDGVVYLVMEYCEGDTLLDKIYSAEYTQIEVMDWCRKIANTMSYVHEQGIYHHDIKPDNILFTNDGDLKISDFGIANKFAGNRYYMAPEFYDFKDKYLKDPRIDIFALGITFIETITGTNPLFDKSIGEIESILKNKDIDFGNTYKWIQEILLKAIDIIPELRFQNMDDFSRAIKNRQVPVTIDKKYIKASEFVKKVETKIRFNKWKTAISELEYANNELYPNSVEIKCLLGKCYLKTRDLSKAQQLFDEAREMSSAIDIQKELGEVNLELKEYPTAISLLNSYIHTHAFDYEAHNLLLRCYYETNRFEVAAEYAKKLMEMDSSPECFENNYYICQKCKDVKTKVNLQSNSNPFLTYNKRVVNEKKKSWSKSERPTLKSKLLFQDYRFNQNNISDNYISLSYNDIKQKIINKNIICFGRKGFDVDISISDSTLISRRHFVIINFKNDVWLYNLSGLGTIVDGEKITDKVFLNSSHTINVDGNKILVKSDAGNVL